MTQGIFRKLFPKNFFPLSHAPQNLEKVWEKFPGYPLGYRPFFGNSFRDLPMWVKNHFSRSYSLFFLGPSTFGFQDRPLSQTVHFKSFEPSSLIHDRPVSVVWTFKSFQLIKREMSNLLFLSEMIQSSLDHWKFGSEPKHQSRSTDPN